MSTFIVVVSPGLLVHLVEKATSCGHPTCVRLVARAIEDEATSLPEPILFAIAAGIVATLHGRRLDPFVEIAWRDSLSAVRRALRFDEFGRDGVPA